jgi:hypothetical protein
MELRESYEVMTEEEERRRRELGLKECRLLIK